LAALDKKTGRGGGRGEATAPAFWNGEKRGLGTERKTFVRLIGRDRDWSDSRDVIDGVGEANGGRAKN
jgi:hypothetical protein